MRINGAWSLSDGNLRPIIRGKLLAANGSLVETPFLLDTGADRSVFSAAILAALGIQPIVPVNQLGGVGGVVDTVLVPTKLYLPLDNGNLFEIQSQFAAFTDLTALDMSVLGRDVTNLFAVIVDRKGDVICMLHPPHQYTIQG
jgi:hypothetical protein